MTMLIRLFAAALVLMATSNAMADEMVRPWWSGSTSGLIGGIAGSIIGICGGIVATLAGKGKGRRFVLGLMAALIVLGMVLLLAGLAAVILAQSYSIYCPLLLLGGLTLILMSTRYRTIRQRFAEIELRKMESMDAS